MKIKQMSRFARTSGGTMLASGTPTFNRQWHTLVPFSLFLCTGNLNRGVCGVPIRTDRCVSKNAFNCQPSNKKKLKKKKKSRSGIEYFGRNSRLW
ncbi:hypothetical protein PUN28_013196 [Cardiocondyla obscurior]|uniref:Secreted protein n=1 Tax=Cardiocondyla obscurior TaxID=286306 RepID=A0AAW2F7H3_9HYME